MKGVAFMTNKSLVGVGLGKVIGVGVHGRRRNNNVLQRSLVMSKERGEASLLCT